MRQHNQMELLQPGQPRLYPHRILPPPVPPGDAAGAPLPCRCLGLAGGMPVPERTRLHRLPRREPVLRSPEAIRDQIRVGDAGLDGPGQECWT